MSDSGGMAASKLGPACDSSPADSEMAQVVEGELLVGTGNSPKQSRDVRRSRCGRRLLMTFGCLAVCGFVAGVSVAVYRFVMRGRANVLERVSLADVDAEAVCNDGRPAAYYRKLRSDSRKWFIFLEGGGWCWDKESCASRNARHVSDASIGDQMLVRQGIMATGSPVGDDFNVVYLPHCSSDAHMGDVGAEHNGVGWPFRGARIVRTALQHATVAGGLGPGDLVVFGGVSAGGRGALVWLDELIPSGALPKGVRLLGYFDSPYYIEMPMFPGLNSAKHNVMLQTQEVVKLMRNEGILGFGGTCGSKEAWMCAFAEHRMPQLKTPFLVIASMYDWYQLTVGQNFECCPFPHPNAEYLRWADDFANRTRAGLLRLPQVRSGQSGLLGTTCYDHALSQWANFKIETTLGMSMQAALSQAIASFTQEDGTPMPSVMDTCRHFHCGTGCTKQLSSLP